MAWPVSRVMLGSFRVHLFKEEGVMMVNLIESHFLQRVIAGVRCEKPCGEDQRDGG